MPRPSSRSPRKPPDVSPHDPDASLTTYRQKRDFRKSPEPTGRSPSKPAKQRFFCVQKHLASHLHYDFRLEHRGVLLSWAIPKGPSLDPSIKRLAMHVEDHPKDYGTFEGVIPSGYGAGIVVLWDRGVWQPLVEDVDAALRRGNLPFLLLGEKLGGAWTLIRSGRVGPNAWLLIKRRDQWSRSSEITLEQPLSVASAGDFPEILARERSNPWPHTPPVLGGETGALFRDILAQAATLRSPQVVKRGAKPRKTRIRQK